MRQLQTVLESWIPLELSGCYGCMQKIIYSLRDGDGAGKITTCLLRKGRSGSGIIQCFNSRHYE